MRILAGLVFAAAALLTGASTEASMHGSGPGLCPYGTALGDGCNTATHGMGVYTRSGFPAYARQSGQTWLADHPQTWNVAGVDYGVGPEQVISSLADIATWPAGQNGCTYYDGAVNQYTGKGWPGTMPVLACTGNSNTNFSISGYNFGQTSGHGCVEIFLALPTSDTETVDIWNDAFINGSSCFASQLGGTNVTGFVTLYYGIYVNVVIENDYFDGKWYDPCCAHVGTGVAIYAFAVVSNQQKGNLAFKWNWLVDMPREVMGIGWITGHEGSCSNGTAYETAGYVFTLDYNYIEGIGSYPGSGHSEVSTFGVGASSYMCAVYEDYNTVLWPAASSASGTATFFGMTTDGSGMLEYNEVEHNTVVTNLVGGSPVASNIASFQMTDANPNEIQVTAGTIYRGGAILGTALGVGDYDSATGAWGGGCNSPGSGSRWAALCPVLGYTITANTAGSLSNAKFVYQVTSEAGAEVSHGSYGELYWANNYIDATGAGTGRSQEVWYANPSAGGGICATPAVLTNNISLLNGGYLNSLTKEGGGC